MVVSTTFDTLLLEHVAHAYEKQMFLGSVIGERSWSYSLRVGKLSFGNDLDYTMQLIGTEATASNSWLWAWANTATKLPPQLLIAANTIKAYGERNSVPLLHTPHFIMGQMNGHYIAMVASGLFKAQAYYRVPFEDSALYILIDDPSFPVDPRHPIERIVANFPRLLSNIPLQNHKAMFIGYLRTYHFLIKTEGNNIHGTYPADRRKIVGVFDNVNRMHQINTSM